jgi:hypothetical protein
VKLALTGNGDVDLARSYGSMPCRADVDDRKILADLAKAVAWSPTGMSADGGCLIAAVHVNGQV